VLTNDLHVDPIGKRVLDVGCGGGLLAEEFARLGCHVVGIDPSRPSLAAAQAHARVSGLGIEYGVAVGEQLPFATASFDIVTCCDVLEHVADVDRVLAEAARVLTVGGLYFYETINRTLLSRLLFITLAQDWLGLLPPQLHEWALFLKPRELHEGMARYGIQNRETVGLRPSLLRLLGALRPLRQGRLTEGEFGRRAGFRVSRATWGSYLGYGIRAASPGRGLRQGPGRKEPQDRAEREARGQDHQKDGVACKREAQLGGGSDLKGWAAKPWPTVKAQ
jgi:2-polyprenyl-6-hydroxyphenyl methylase / 3-demethylubiquinone-9 3-methyltransferase